MQHGKPFLFIPTNLRENNELKDGGEGSTSKNMKLPSL